MRWKPTFEDFEARLNGKAATKELIKHVYVYRAKYRNILLIGFKL